MAEAVAARVQVAGDVQGVAFRAHTRDRMAALGVTGWVRNRPDGRVEAHLEGDRPAVEAAIDFCHEGSPAATVEAVDVDWVAPAGHDAFTIRR